ncbi:MAG: hypothetical protein MI785_07300 [Kiloniellales bacterium]|nr:hypothetical protein [Kiloniellales bacterium]
MSYDLYFGTKNGREPPSRGDLTAYFDGRACYRVTGSQATYDNRDTGVYFHFDLADSTEPEILAELGEDAFRHFASFNINYYRPHIFGLEAAPELAAFIARFDLATNDPQVDGRGRKPFREEGFLEGWNDGNFDAYRNFAKDYSGEDFHALPAELLEAVWSWNRDRGAHQERLGQNVFVPKISMVTAPEGGPPRTMVVWPDALPSVLPRVDMIFIPRQQLAPRRFFLRQEDLAVTTWADAAPLILGFRQVPGPLPYWKLDYETPPKEVAAFVADLEPVKQDDYQMLANDQVLTLELLQAACGEETTRDRTSAT